MAYGQTYDDDIYTKIKTQLITNNNFKGKNVKIVQ